MAASSSGPKNQLAFDTAKSSALELDLFLTLNNLFAQAGKNFNTDLVWNATDCPAPGEELIKKTLVCRGKRSWEFKRDNECITDVTC